MKLFLSKQNLVTLDETVLLCQWLNPELYLNHRNIICQIPSSQNYNHLGAFYIIFIMLQNASSKCRIVVSDTEQSKQLLYQDDAMRCSLYRKEEESAKKHTYLFKRLYYEVIRESLIPIPLDIPANIDERKHIIFIM